MALGIFKGPGIGSTHLLFSISVLFRSVPLQFHSIERKLNRKGTGLEWEWNGMVMERERNGNGTEMEQKFNGLTMNAQFMVPGLLYDCTQARSPKSSFHCPSIELLFHFCSIPIPFLFHSRSISVPFQFRSSPIPFPFRSSPVQLN